MTITCGDQADSMGILMAGDRITKINGTPPKDASVLDMVSSRCIGCAVAGVANCKIRVTFGA